MATLKMMIFAAILVICMYAVRSEELFALDEPLNLAVENDGVDLYNSATVVKKPLIDTFTPEDEALVRECANKFIKDCEQGRKCRQIKCPAETSAEVSITI